MKHESSEMIAVLVRIAIDGNIRTIRGIACELGGIFKCMIFLSLV